MSERSEDGVPRPGSSDAERVWVARARTGDVKAFEAIFRTYYDQLCSFSERILRSPDAARDAVQDVFVRIWEQRQSCQGCNNLKAYLFTAVRNRSFKMLRHSAVVRRSHDQMTRESRGCAVGAAPASPEANAQLAELTAAVQRTIDDLPDRCREAYLLHRQHGMSYSEIAELMGVSARTVENHIARALRGLREGLSAWIT